MKEKKVIINPKHVIAIIPAPKGVKHKTSNINVGLVDSTIIMTTRWTYVVKNFSYKSNFKETLTFKLSDIKYSEFTKDCDLVPDL